MESHHAEAEHISRRRVLHSVQFYRNDAFLLEAVLRFVVAGLESGDGVVVIATPDHLHALRRLLPKRDDLSNLFLQSTEDVLDAISIDGIPDAAAFEHTVGPLTLAARAASRSRHVRAYGEMVDVLWRQNRAAAVMKLEQLWCSLVERERVELLCGYNIEGFGADARATRFFSAISHIHDHVAPTEVVQDAIVRDLERRADALETARERTARLLRVTSSLSTAITCEDIASLSLEVIVDALGAQSGSLWLVGPNGRTTLAGVFPERPANDDTTQLVVPLLLQGRSIGSIELHFPTWRDLGVEDRDFISSVATITAHAIDRTLVYEREKVQREEAERRQRESELFSRLCDAVHRANNLGEVHEAALDAICTTLGVERAAILLYDDAMVMRFMASRSLSEAYRKAVEGHSPWKPDAVDPQPVFIADAAADPELAAYRDLFASEGIGALGFIPLVHQRLLGKLMVYSNAPRVFDARDVQRASAIAAQIAQAVSRTKLLASERATADRLRRLQEITADMSKAKTSAEVADVVVSNGTLAFGARTGGLWLVDGDALVLTAYRSDNDMVRFARIPLDHEVPAAVVARTNEPSWIECKADLDRLYPALATAVPEDVAIACVPLAIGARCIGVLALSFDNQRALSVDERQALLVLAGHAAQALDRGRLFELESKARARAEAERERLLFLGEAATLLSSCLDARESLHRLAELAVPRLCDVCAITVEADGKRVGVVVPPGSTTDGAAQKIVAPITARGRQLGTIALAATTSGRSYDQDDRDFADHLARRAGLAFDNVMLYEAANEAARAREEVLAVVSHDLRNPVGAIMMHTGNLLRLPVDGPVAPRVKKYGEAIERSANRMARMIDDLLDFANMQAGRFSIRRAPCSPTEIIAAVTDLFAPLAHDRHLTLETAVQDDLPSLACDADRIVQAIGNFLSNAIKATSPGGKIVVGAQRTETDLVWWVDDTGPGLRQEDLPRLFDRYWRADKTHYKGTGLGLAIAKGIVDAHAGRIWADSQLGQGSRFSFSIPLNAPNSLR